MILKSVWTWSSTRSQTRAWVVSPNVRVNTRPWLTVTSATLRRTRCSSTTATRTCCLFLSLLLLSVVSMLSRCSSTTATRTWRTSSTSTAAERSTSRQTAVPWRLWRIWSTGGSKRRALSHAVSNDGWSARSRQDHHNHDHLHLDLVETRRKEQVEWEQAREEVKVEEFPEGTHVTHFEFQIWVFQPCQFFTSNVLF